MSARIDEGGAVKAVSSISIRPADDDYPTPPEATRALVSVERFGGGIWEPCAGRGDMAATLREGGYDVRATTLGAGRHNTGWNGWVMGGLDFLQAETLIRPNIVTNPPYRLAEEIVRHAIALKPIRIAMFLNLRFLGSRARKTGLFADHPPARIHVFCDRVTMYPAGFRGKRGVSTETMAWFVWAAPFHAGASPAIHWLDSAEHREAALTNHAAGREIA